MPATLARAMAATAITATRNLAIDFAICVLPPGTREGGGAAVDLMLKMLRWFPLVSPITPSWNWSGHWMSTGDVLWPFRQPGPAHDPSVGDSQSEGRGHAPRRRLGLSGG